MHAPLQRDIGRCLDECCRESGRMTRIGWLDRRADIKLFERIFGLPIQHLRSELGVLELQHHRITQSQGYLRYIDLKTTQKYWKEVHDTL